MFTSVSTKGRSLLLLAAGIAVGVVALSALYADDAKDMLLGKLGLSHGKAIADASCALPKDSSDDIYFVSCAGFF